MLFKTPVSSEYRNLHPYTYIIHKSICIWTHVRFLLRTSFVIGNGRGIKMSLSTRLMCRYVLNLFILCPCASTQSSSSSQQVTSRGPGIAPTQYSHYSTKTQFPPILTYSAPHRVRLMLAMSIYNMPIYKYVCAPVFICICLFCLPSIFIFLVLFSSSVLYLLSYTYTYINVCVHVCICVSYMRSLRSTRNNIRSNVFTYACKYIYVYRLCAWVIL